MARGQKLDGKTARLSGARSIIRPAQRHSATPKNAPHLDLPKLAGPSLRVTPKVVVMLDHLAARRKLEAMACAVSRPPPRANAPATAR